jgi:hypothetical protein
MEDVRLGRVEGLTEANVAVGLASVAVVTSAPTRAILILGSTLVGTMSYSTVNPAVAGAGLQVGAGGPPIVLDIKHHGQFTTAAWFGICSSAAQSVFVGQTLLAVT